MQKWFWKCLIKLSSYDYTVALHQINVRKKKPPVDADPAVALTTVETQTESYYKVGPLIKLPIIRMFAGGL